jgi:LysW-gamma-L-lysine carboxypeptidase
MVEIYSPSDGEEEIASFLYNELKVLGFTTSIDSVGNVIGEHGYGEPEILLCGHMDTVPGALPVEIEGDILKGRGSVDAKGPLATFVVAASQLMNEGYDGSLKIIGVVDEEGEGKGIKQVLKNGISVDYAIFGEPTNVDTITIGYRGSLLMEFTIKTETGHSSAPWLFENSIEKAFQLWEKIKTIKMSEEKGDSHFYSTSYSLERIKGGVEGSIVPPICRMEIAVRVPPPLKVDQILDKVQKVIREFSEANPKVELSLEVKDATNPYMADPRSNLVRAISRSIWMKKGKRAMLIRKTGTGDMNIFGNRLETPCVTYGPGDPHLDHTSYEHIKISDYLESIKIVKQAIFELSEMHK